MHSRCSSSKTRQDIFQLIRHGPWAAAEAAAAAGDVESQGIAEAPTNAASETASSTAKFRDRRQQPELYALMLEIHNKYTTTVRLLEVYHAWSTQKNEAMNQCFTKYAPKGRDYSGSGSLFRRICTGIGVGSVGLLEYYPAVFRWIGFKAKLQTQQTTFFATRDHQNDYHYDHKCLIPVKRKRTETKTEEMAVQSKETGSTDTLRGNDYGTGFGLLIAMGEDGATPHATATTSDETTATTSNETLKKCSRCSGTDHLRSTIGENRLD